MLLQQGGHRAVLCGRRPERLHLAQRVGIRQIVDAKRNEAAEAILSLTEGRGADALVECTGRQDVWESAPQFVRRGGVVSFFGGLPGTARVAFLASRLHYDEVRLISPFHFTPRSVRRAYDLLASGAIDPLPLISGTVPLSEVPAVFERLDNGEGIKFAIEP